MSFEKHKQPQQQHNQILNICKICKKLYKDKAGLLEHQRLQHQHSQLSVQSQIQQQNNNAMANNNLKSNKEINKNSMASFTNLTWKDRQNKSTTDAGGTGGGGLVASVNNPAKMVKIAESYATLQKPPANLQPRLQSQSIKQQNNLLRFTSDGPSCNTTTIENADGDPDDWQKWEPEKEGGAMIISASVAASTAACYSPVGSPPQPNQSGSSSDEMGIPTNNGCVQTSSKASSSSLDLLSTTATKPNSGALPHSLAGTGRQHIAQLPVFNISSKIQQANSMANKAQQIIASAVSGKANSNGTGLAGRLIGQQKRAKMGMGGNLGGSGMKTPLSGSAAKNVPRIPVPKLMSKTKAQFQILKSQATRPKMVPKTPATNSFPRVGIPSPAISAGSNAPTTPTTPTTLAPPRLTKQSEHPLVPEERFKNPPQLLREPTYVNSGKGPANSLATKGGTTTATRGAPATGRGALASKRGAPVSGRGSSANGRGSPAVGRGAPMSGRGRGRGGRLPPPSTKRADGNAPPRAKSRSPSRSRSRSRSRSLTPSSSSSSSSSSSDSPTSKKSLNSRPAQRGRPRGGATPAPPTRGKPGNTSRGRPIRLGPQAAATPILRRESLNTPSNSEESGSDSEDEDLFSPIPAKKLRLSESSPKKLKQSKSSEKVDEPINPKNDDGKRIYGKDYKCPALEKVASYLNKKGTRIWICLVCEETEEEISRGPMIACDICEDWYHFSCVGIEAEPPEDEKWFCKRCLYKNIQTKLKNPTATPKGNSPAKKSQSPVKKKVSFAKSKGNKKKNGPGKKRGPKPKKR